MSDSKQVHADEAARGRIPAQSLPPSPDLGFVIPPLDPLGLPTQPAASTKPIRRDDGQPSMIARLAMLIVVAVAAIAFVAWLLS
jgi:hypothetical protein